MSGTKFSLEIQPRIPLELSDLNTFANDLYYGWDWHVRTIFRRFDPQLWNACGHNPKLFLRRVSQQKLDSATQDRSFLERYNRALTHYEGYQSKPLSPDLAHLLDPENDLVAYFCFEFGLHESLPIYSGGLGILAGDHCKAASDMGVPFVAVGLLYRQGYFTQQIDSNGQQTALFKSSDFEQLPISIATDKNGNPVKVAVTIHNRTVQLQVWKVRAGRISLYLLDSDLPENIPQDRSITYQLYGGNRETRIQQEIVLGIGGVRALRALGLQPNVWHINEGHAAFSIIERSLEYVQAGLKFDAAFEAAACNTVFTTHTPVPAGHDIFEPHLIEQYFTPYLTELGINQTTYMELGRSPNNHGTFNMTALALRGSRFHNGVSRIHGSVASNMESYIWPQIDAEENPISYITNGVHLSTFLAIEWITLFDMRLPDWRNQINNEEFWDCIHEIPDHRFWSVRKELKTHMLRAINERIAQQYLRQGRGNAELQLATQLSMDESGEILILGFARRFATYKRANLIFRDLDRLKRLLNNPDQPVMLVFAGKAHPNDGPGQEFIKEIYHLSQHPDFVGKILLLENYDLALARRLISGVDVWINTPRYPLEASGTSGQKAGMNGVLNLSVLDGWWGESYNGENGWAISPHEGAADERLQDHLEAAELLDIIEHQVIPAYFERNNSGFSEHWINMSKESIKSILPKFNSQRMVKEYIKNFYVSAKQQNVLLTENQFENAVALSGWKKNIASKWSGVSMHCTSVQPDTLQQGDTVQLSVEVKLNGLSKDDLRVECIIFPEFLQEQMDRTITHSFTADTENSSDTCRFTLNLKPDLSGLVSYKIRAYPYHQLLAHPFETGCMIWI